jgi:hypothetical protein
MARFPVPSKQYHANKFFSIVSALLRHDRSVSPLQTR